MEFIDLGHRPKDSGFSKNKPSKTPPVYYPSLNIENKSIPIEEYQVGKTITAVVRLKVNAISRRIDSNKEKNKSVSFDVLAINFPDKNKVNVASMKGEDLDNLERQEFGLMSLTKRRGK